MIAEEKIFRIDARLDAAQLVGMEGAWGLIIFIPIALIVNGMTCEENTTNPELLVCENGYVDDFGFAINQIRSNSSLFWLLFSFLILNVSASIFGVYIIKQANAMERVTIAHTRIAYVWFFFIIYKGNGHQDFNWL